MDRTTLLVLLSWLALSAGGAASAAAAPINCDAVMKKPIGQQTQEEFEQCSKPALHKAVCDALEEAARTNGCDKRGARDPRCVQLGHVLLTCLGTQPPKEVRAPVPSR